MSREYKADEYEINQLKRKLQTGSDKIINGHKDIKQSVENKLNSVLSEYGDCSSISSTVRAIRALLEDADGDVRQMESDMDGILNGLEFTIRSTRESQQEINSIIGRLEMPTFDTLDVGGETSYTNTNSVMLKTPNDVTNDFLASTMIGGVLPVVLAADDGAKTFSLLEQSTNITPDINSAEDAKEYLKEVERKRKLKEIAEEKYGDINSQEDAKEYLDGIERKKFKDMMQENYGFTWEESQNIMQGYYLLLTEANNKGLDGQKKIHFISSYYASLCDNYDGESIRWKYSGDIPPTKTTLRYLEEIGMSRENVTKLYSTINRQHINPKEKDFAHELVQYAIFSDDSFFHNILECHIGNMNALSSYKGDVYSGGMGIDDMNSDVDAINIYNRMLSKKDNLFETMLEYNELIKDNKINRVDEFLMFYGKGDIDEGLKYIKEDLYATDIGSHYIGGDYETIPDFVKETVQDIFFTNAMINSGVGQDTFDSLIKHTNRGSVISKSTRIQDLINDFIKYLEEGKS